MHTKEEMLVIGIVVNVATELLDSVNFERRGVDNSGAQIVVHQVAICLGILV